MDNLGVEENEGYRSLRFHSSYYHCWYRLPLFEIVGVTSIKLMFSVGFAYLKHKREENFKWALKKLKELFSSEKLLLNIVVTDQELALMNAIEFVFSNSTHLLCSFHISKNVRMNVKSMLNQKDMSMS
ncbi:hypothetical protein KIW84_070610 [Lathyrus oleraceus]|uniref:MULE transposase domain-containing protein n=1 Tax=Pisum sativum TaxID=3888 RepID=A0A9D4VGN2_PEA|nr:hypothetical protein KIW84_070610 [Pisum sativum]